MELSKDYIHAWRGESSNSQIFYGKSAVGFQAVVIPQLWKSVGTIIWLWDTLKIQGYHCLSGGALTESSTHLWYIWVKWVFFCCYFGGPEYFASLIFWLTSFCSGLLVKIQFLLFGSGKYNFFATDSTSLCGSVLDICLSRKFLSKFCWS